MDAATDHEAVKELHGDLSRKYRLHGTKIEQIWRSLSKEQRSKAMKAGAAEGFVLKHPLDPSMGNVSKFMPEWNLRDVTAPGSDFFLELLRHRATKSLGEQYMSGFSDRPGDYGHITEMMQTRNLRHTDSFQNCYTFFIDGDTYGQSFKIIKDHDATLAGFQPAIRAGVCIPQSTGELVLLRQLYLLQCLNIMIDDILDVGSTTRSQKVLPKKSADAATAALAKISIQAPPMKLDLPDLIASAADQRSSLEDTLNLVCTESVVLTHAVNIWFYSRRELVPDEKGRMLPAHTDKYISGAFLEAVHSAIKGAAIWNYMCRLLELLETSADKSHRAIILQEVSNICHLEYTRVQALFKRHVSTASGSKWFKRVSNVYDNGNARVTMKGDPELLMRENPQLLYMLRLCQPETTAAKAIDWIKKLDDLHRAHPLEREAMAEREADALSDMAIIVSFVQSLSPVISMPAFHRKKGQLFVSKSNGLEAELNQLKTQVDLAEFAVPIDNLLEPGMAEGALSTLDQFIVEKTGSKMGFLYQDLIDDCVSHLQDQIKSKTEQQTKADYVPLSSTSPQSPEVRLQQRRQKEKTRPTHSSIYQITSQPETTAEEDSEAPQPPQTFKVNSTTAEVFSTLFSTSESRGSVSWAAFEAAMADLGFSVVPKFGSVYTFCPPGSMHVQKSLTIHRPHKSHIEGYLLLLFARRLKRVYGWKEGTFVLT
jgi:hypothetical protein